MPNDTIRSYKVNGDILDIPQEKQDAFIAKFPDAVEVKSFTLGSDTLDIPLDKVGAFQAKFPQAKSIYDTTPEQSTTTLSKIDSVLEAGGTETAPRQVEPAQEQPLPFSLEKSPEEFFASTRQEAEQQLTTPVVESTISVQPKPVEKTGEEVAQEIKVAEERKASIDIDAKEIMGMPGATDEEIGLYYYDLGSEGDNTRGQDILPSRERITRSLKGKGYTDEEIASYFSLKRYDSLGAEAISNRYRDSKISGKEEKIRSKFSDIMTEDEIKQTASESYVKEYENNSIDALLNDIGETDSGDYVVLLNQFMDLREELKGLGEDDQQKRSQLKLELIEVDSKLDAIRESGEAFLNPYTGLRGDADQEAINEAKSKEYDSTIEEVKDLPFDQLQKAHNKIYNEYFSLLEENPNFSREGIQSNEEGIQLLMDEKRYKEQLAISEARFNAINRAYILNEDVTKQDRSGFFGSLTKTLLEETVAPALGLPKATGATDEIVNFVNTLKEENFDLTPEQESQAELLFSEKAGSAVGTTIPIIAEFLATRKVADPIILNKWNKIDDVVKASLKDSKVSRGAYSILSSGVKESILFELAPSEQVSGVMGFAEGATQEALDLMDVGGWILKKGAGKYAKLLEFGVKTTAGTISEGFAELAGEYTDQLVETGFDTEKAFENAFGRTGDEILDNILLTTIISGGMSGASNIGVAVKGLEQLKARGFKKTQEVYNEMPQSTKDGMNEETKSKLEDVGIEIEETKIEEDVTETAEEVTPTEVEVQEEVAVDEDIQPQPEGVQEEDVQDVPKTAVEEEAVESVVEEQIEATEEAEPPKGKEVTAESVEPTTEEMTENVEEADIQRRRKEELNKPLESVKNAKNKEDLIKASEEWIGINPYDDGAVSMGVRSLLMTPGSFEKGKQAFIEENKKIAEIRDKQIKAKYDAELAALKQKIKEVQPKVTQEVTEEVEPIEVSLEDIKNTDPKSELYTQKAVDFLSKIEEDLDQFGKETLGVNLPLAVIKPVVKTIKTLVSTGVPIEQAIRDAAKKYNVKEQDVNDTLSAIERAKKTKVPVEEQTSFDLIPSDLKSEAVNSIIKAEVINKVDDTYKADEGLKTIQRSDFYKNLTTEQQQEIDTTFANRIDTDVRSAVKARVKPTDASKAAKEISRKKKTRIEVDESKALIDQIKLEAKAAKEGAKSVRDQVDLMNEKINEFISDNKDRLKNVPKEKISQISRIFNKRIATPAAFNNAISKIEEILDIGEFNKKVRTAKRLNSKIKSGGSDAAKAMGVLKDMNPELMNEELLDDYIELVKSTKPGSKQVAPPRDVLSDFADRYNREKAPEKIKTVKEKTEAEIEEKEIADTKAKNEAISDLKLKIRKAKPKKSEAIKDRSEAQKDLINFLFSLSDSQIESLTKLEIEKLGSIFEEIQNNRLKGEAHYDFVRKIKKDKSSSDIVGVVEKNRKGQQVPDKLKKVAETLIKKYGSATKAKVEIVKSFSNTTLGDLIDVNNTILNSEVIKKITQPLRKARNLAELPLKKLEKAYSELNKGQFITDNMARVVAGKRSNINLDRDIRRVARSIALDMYAVQKMHESNGGTGDNVKARLDATPGKDRGFSFNRDSKIYEALLEKYNKTVDGEKVLDTDAMWNDMPYSMKQYYNTWRDISDNDLAQKIYDAEVYYRGGELKLQKDYAHIVPSSWTPENSNFESLKGEGSFIKPSAKASAAKEKKGVDTPHRWGLHNNATKVVNDTYLDFYLTPSLQTDFKALEELSNQGGEEAIVYKVLYDYVDGIMKSEMTFQDPELSKAAQKWSSLIMARAYQGALDTVARMPAEIVSNIILAAKKGFLSEMFSSKNLAFKALNDKSERSKWEKMMRENGSSLTNALGRDPLEVGEAKSVFKDKTELSEGLSEGIADLLYKNKASRLTQKSSDLINVSTDRLIRFPLWTASFNQSYKEQTGKDFDINDQSNKEAIERAVRVADTQVSEKISPSAPEEVALRQKTFRGKDKTIAKKLWTEAQHFMTNFAFNQNRQLVSALRLSNIKSDPVRSAEIISKVMLNNMVYNVMIQSLTAGMLQLVGDDDEFDELLESMSTGEYWGRQVLSAGITSGLGRLKTLEKGLVSSLINTLNVYANSVLGNEKPENLIYSPNSSAWGGYGNTREVWGLNFGAYGNMLIDAGEEGWDVISRGFSGDLEAKDALQAFYIIQPSVGVPLARDVKKILAKEKRKEKDGVKMSKPSKRTGRRSNDRKSNSRR